MNYAALKEELLLPEYDGMTADEKRQHYNAKMVTVLQLVPLEVLQGYLSPEGLLPVLEARIADTSDPFAQVAAKELMFLFGPYSRRNDVDVNHPRFKAGLDALQAAGDLSADGAQKAAISALGNKQVHVSKTKPGLPRTISAQMADNALNGGY